MQQEILPQINRQTAIRLLLCICLMSIAFANCLAQSGTARVTGLVTDPSGAIIPGALVQMTQTGTGLVRTTVTNSDGTYVLPELPAGPYQLQVKKEGFQGYIQSGIVLEVATTPTLNVSLQVGAVTQEVTVESDAAIIETHSAALGQVVNQQEVVAMPLNQRDPMQLLTFTPAALNAPGASNNTSMNFPNPIQISFAGSDPGEGTYLLDGGNDNDQQSSDSFPLPFPDALQEFNVVASAVPAQYGLHGSASVNAITKSGTNKIHGDAFEFVRNAAFNDRSFYAPIKDPLKRNQYGGVIGGPIRKDKIFFFAGVQNTVVSDKAASTVYLPTTQELAGDFTNGMSATCNNGSAVVGKGPLAGTTKLSPANYALPAVNLAKLLPTPSDQVCGQYNYQTLVKTTSPQVIGKVDYTINTKHSAYVRYFYDRYYLPPDLTNIITQSQHDQRDTYQSVTVGETWVISNSIVNAFHANTNHAYDIKGFDPQVGTPASIGVGGNYYNPVANYMSMTVSNYFGIKGGGLNPVYFNPTDYQVSDDLEITRKSHQLAVGVNFIHFNMSQQSTINANGNFTFNGGTTGLAMADYFLGDISTFNQSNIIWDHPPKRYIGVYGQDAWQITHSLTLNYGLRWEPYIAPGDSDGEGMYFSYSNFATGVHSKVYPNAPAGAEYSANRNGAGDYGGGYGNSYLSSWGHFEPRVGISYDPRGKGREVIRASYGTFYNFEPGQYNLPTVSSPPWADTLTLTGRNLANPWGACPANSGLTCAAYSYNGSVGVDPFPIAASSTLIFPPAASYASWDSLNVKEAMQQQWNLSLEKQFGTNWSITATYLGNHTVHVPLYAEGNPGTYVPPGSCGLASPTAACSTSSNTQARRYLSMINPTQGALISTIALFEDNGIESYNGAAFTLRKRLSNHTSVITNYTYGHCLDTGEITGTSPNAVYRGPINMDKGNCTWDHRHALTVTGTLTSPQFSSKWIQWIAGNWEMAPIFTHISGDWLTVTTGTDTALTGDTTNQWPNAVAGVSRYQTPTRVGGGVYGTHWLNPAAFSVPTAQPGFTGNVVNVGFGPVTLGPIGNLGRGRVQGPANTDFDASLTRNIRIREQMQLQLRFEAFNVFNHTRLNDPVLTLNSPTFGESTAPLSVGNINVVAGYPTQQDPRIMQFALKFVF